MSNSSKISKKEIMLIQINSIKYIEREILGKNKTWTLFTNFLNINKRKQDVSFAVEIAGFPPSPSLSHLRVYQR